MAETVMRHVMGLPVLVEVRDETTAADAVQRVFEWLAWVDRRFSPYRPDSDVRRRCRRDDAHVHGVVGEVLARCGELRTRTAGAFDVRASGRLDPSGFVKGWAVDRAIELLAADGVRSACVNAGGDVRVLGGPWRVGVQHPHRRDRLAAVLELTNGAVATSGAYERGPHIVDPRTGAPAAGAVAVTVVGPELGTADAYATAAFAMGAEAPAWCAGLEDEGYGAMVVLPEDRVLTTPELRRRLRGRADTADSLRA